MHSSGGSLTTRTLSHGQPEVMSRTSLRLEPASSLPLRNGFSKAETEVRQEDSETNIKNDLAKIEAATLKLNPGPTSKAADLLADKMPKPNSPLLSRIRWFNLGVVVLTPLAALYGALTTRLRWETAVLSVFGYVVTMLGITAGYHRLWSHRSYTASLPLQYTLAIMGGASVQGSIRWWARGHRSHHRYTDTDLDPYSAKKGFWFSHVGWMLVDPLVRPGRADVSDLSKSQVIAWQRKYYFQIALIFGILLPLFVAGLGWGDWRGGFYYACLVRIVAAHHSTFSINSVAHLWGQSPYDDKHTPRDNFFAAFLTLGEGYHNFHHQFPMDYRNAIKYYQFDPTKWFIYMCEQTGLANNLQRFSLNEIRKGQFAMQAKKLLDVQNSLVWGKKRSELPIITWEEYQKESTLKTLVLVAGFVHDVSSLLDHHPGGRVLLAAAIGKDATVPFFGGVYDHSNAAKNLLSTMRVAALEGGVEIITEQANNTGHRLYVAEGRWDD